MQKWRIRFSEIYRNYYKNPNSIIDEELKEFKKIVSFVDIQELYKWVSPVLQEIDIELKKEMNKKQKMTFLGGIFNTKIKEEELLTQEEIQTIEKIFNEAVTQITEKNILNKNEIKLEVHFDLNAGFFNFTKSLERSASSTFTKETNLEGSEAFCFRYKNLKFTMKKGENFMNIETMLKEFSTEMVTIINKNETVLPITFTNDFSESTRNSQIEISTRNSQIELSESKRNSQIQHENADYIWKLNFRQNSPLDEINSIFQFHIKTTNLLYHQTFLDRVMSFFTVEINEDLVNSAWDKWNIIKEKTSNSIKYAFTKKNILEINIEPRKLIIPINKYDFKNSKILSVEVGQIKVFNSDITDNYEDQFNLEFSVDSISVRKELN